ncbi:hypothetical protein HH310_19905 [Actinoplanes sp. TBRC 11911]|uniref:hypothetical protein n=1 Tax=Actinoplanes sp. TBRC 11911 TaxID=2729386 RepID=UPI00145E1F87|nr:hypothetical protein [Actinoplanes sp. TBRC 11911]NMO53441.1 hypothetical protein [Actinoplanes sp. TBRC 11911]
MPELLSPTDADLIDRTRRLVTYLRFVRRNSRSGARDSLKGASPLWLAELLALQADPEQGSFLVLERPSLVPYPEPPPGLAGWLSPEFVATDPWGPEPSLREPPHDRSGAGDAEVPDHVLAVFADWSAGWSEWMKQQKAAQTADDLFASLKKMIEKAGKNEHELVLGVGAG